MRARRTEWLILGLLALVLLVASVLSARAEQTSEADLLAGSTYSSGPAGTRALFLWLDDLGYAVERFAPDGFGRPPARAVLWLFDPALAATESEAEALADWVEAGGTLVWAEDVTRLNPSLLDAFGLVSKSGDETPFSDFLIGARPVVPWLTSPTARYDGFDAVVPLTDTHPLLADTSGRIGAVRLRRGAGDLWFFTNASAFTNSGLHDEANRALVQGVVERLPADAPLLFDEYHHGFGGRARAEESGLLREMRRAPWGWGLFYAAGVAALWLLLRGRSFGRPLPLPGEHLRREAGEYVQSMAWLYRRARQRDPILRHHHERLKRRVTERYRLPATSDDAAFVRALARYRPDVDQGALLGHLRALQAHDPSESRLLALARANDEWLERLM